jgi:hypothetical protein
MYEVILKRFETPDELREFEKGRFELLHIGAGGSFDKLSAFLAKGVLS